MKVCAFLSSAALGFVWALARRSSSAALGCFGFCVCVFCFWGSLWPSRPCESLMRLKVAQRRPYTNRGSRTKHCQAAPSCHQRQPLTRKVGDRVPKQWLGCVSCWPIMAGVLSSATLCVWRAVLTCELNVRTRTLYQPGVVFLKIFVWSVPS